MLDKGIIEQTVTDYKDIHKQAKDDNLQTPMEMPYFEGDFWPNVIEECIREAVHEENERKKLEAEAQAADVDDDDDESFSIGDKDKKKNSKSSKKKSLKSKSSKNKKKLGSITGNEVTDKLMNNFEKHKEVFFTIRLVTPQTASSVQNTEIKDPDPLIASELMDGRDTFLTKAREEHWEFSSLRRSKYSTMCLCHALHVQDQNKELITCNNCSNQNAAWHCPQCEVSIRVESCLNKITTTIYRITICAVHVTRRRRTNTKWKGLHHWSTMVQIHPIRRMSIRPTRAMNRFRYQLGFEYDCLCILSTQ
jgi:E1A/CREB-binding protein